MMSEIVKNIESLRNINPLVHCVCKTILWTKKTIAIFRTICWVLLLLSR